MNRTILTVTGVLSASSLLLVVSAVKGTVLLALAAVAAMMLRRDSAATRHLVWLLAIVAMLAVPVLSAVLPQWRVPPAWTSHSAKPAVVDVSPPSIGIPTTGVVESPMSASPEEVERPSATVFQPPTAPPVLQPAVVTPAEVPAPAVWDWSWISALPLVWAIGFAVLMLRLSAARWMLWNSERLATVVWSSAGTGSKVVDRSAIQRWFAERTTTFISATAQDPIVVAMKAICSQLGISRPVTLLIHPDKTIPVVWGILRCRLMLPAAARQWSDEQLQSVLLHELTHIKRRDAVVQLLTQGACALHWFNPLVWFAAWRLDVERERSCDDLVLASGIRPSAYAGHLLNVVSGLSPARWTQVCGLAMARKSSLESRLSAVLGKDLNRRSVSVTLAGLALSIAVGIAVPIAMLRAADEKGNPPQERKDVVPTASITVELAPETVAKLKWGEPVNGLRMALAWPPALGDTMLGKEPYFELVVQNVSENELHFIAGDEAPNPRRMLIREGERIVLGLSDPEVSAADWRLKPGQCGVLRLYTKEEGDKNGTIPSSAIESDLSKIGRYHAIVQMEIAKAPVGAWTGKLVTGQTRGSADVAAAPAPKHKDARALYEVWQRYARANGDIPGALVGELAAAVKTFIKYNPTWETVPKLNAILPRLDATHDWKSADVIALLDEVAGVQDSPLKSAADKATRSTIRKGEALPKKFADAPWGDAQPNGLRAAWVLEPSAAEHRIGAALKARLLVWNSGAVSVSLQVPTFHQGGVKARDAKDAEVPVSGISWTTRALLVPVRLAPGEYIEIRTPGVCIGPRAGMGPWAGPRVGSNVLAKAGDELTLTHGLVPLDGSEVGVSEDDPHVSGPGWWLAHIKSRLSRELPVPDDDAERTRMLDRAVRELFATAPTAEETAAFIADKTPDAVEALAKRLAARVDVVSFSGKLPTAPAKFRVLAADANADKQPRVVIGPGEYPLPSSTPTRGDATLKIVGRSVEDRQTNDAEVLFEAVEFTGALAPAPYKLEVPDGWCTWAIVCRPGDGFFYLLNKGEVRKIDYSKPREVTDTLTNDMPAEFLDEVKSLVDILDNSAESQAEIFEKPAPPAAASDSQAGAIEPADDQAQLKPKHETARSLFRKWQESARPDGKIPGALIGHVAHQIELFLTQFPQDENAPQLAALLPRLDASRDWTQKDVVALLDDITAISTSPMSSASHSKEYEMASTVQRGKLLPKELENAAWGEPAASGLRAAWLLEPAPLLVDTGGEAFPTTENLYRHGSVLKSRVLFHNAGKSPVVFQTEPWHHSDTHTARDAKGAEVSVTGTRFRGITTLATFRLAPGEYCEVSGHGIAIGTGEYQEDLSISNFDAIIEANVGDVVTLSHSVGTLDGGAMPLPIVSGTASGVSQTLDAAGNPIDPVEFWEKIVTERVAKEAPMPASAADREQLIRRVTLNLTGQPPTPEEIAAFIAYNEPDVLDLLSLHLQGSAVPWKGKLLTGESTFRVIAADPNAAKTPHTANGPGRYLLGENIHLQVTQITNGDGSTNKATIIFPDPEPEAARGPKPYEFELPNGIGTYGIVWERGVGALWVVQKDLVRKYDFTDPWHVSETRFAEGGIINIPEQMQEPLKKVFDVTDALKQEDLRHKQRVH